ncbi:MAG TPA: squalene/phytoene synthase family protein, partial [Candidatus Eisenbacteria bacterium]|nr:squalene/phytoene synthase family protein [Candidatus Eisenbacteria bacterium]
MSTVHAVTAPPRPRVAPDPADLDFCRVALPRVSRTFALNIRLLDGTLGEAVRDGYLLCRAADALEDSWPGAPSAIEDRFRRFRLALAGDACAAAGLSSEARALGSDRTDLGLIVDLERLLRVMHGLPAPHREALVGGVDTLAAGMSRYAAREAARGSEVAYLDTEEELDDYCWVVAGCVGVMLTRLFDAEYGAVDPGLAARRVATAPVVGQALQLTNILLDWPHDVRHGRCHVPTAWLAEAGITTRDLVDGSHPGTVAVARRLERKARAALAQVPDYLDLI